MELQSLNWTTVLAVGGYVAMNPPVRSAIGWASAIVAPMAARIPVRKFATSFAIALLAVVLFADAPLKAQMRRGSSRGSGVTNAAGSDPTLASLVASFEGTVRAVTKKGFTVELTNGNTVEFRTSKKTEYLDGDKPIHLKDLEVEAFVKVDGVKDGFGFITANRVVLPPPAAAVVAPKS